MIETSSRRLLSKKTPIEITGKPHCSVNIPLLIYPDVNIIFGPKGTGKTEILDSLYARMLADGKSCKSYIATERGDEFSALLSLKEMEIDLNKVHASPCQDEFEILAGWTDCNPTQFSNYLEWNKTKGNSHNKSRMKITEAVLDHFEKNKKYETHANDKKIIDKITVELQDIEIKEYLPDDEADHLLALMEHLQSNLILQRKKDLIMQYSSNMTNWTIDKMKALADKNSDTISRPSTAGLKTFAQKRIQLFHVVKKVLLNFGRSRI